MIAQRYGVADDIVVVDDLNARTGQLDDRRDAAGDAAVFERAGVELN